MYIYMYVNLANFIKKICNYVFIDFDFEFMGFFCLKWLKILILRKQLFFHTNKNVLKQLPITLIAVHHSDGSLHQASCSL